MRHLVELALALLALAGAAVAQQVTRIADVEVTVDSPWPEVMARGYAPIFVTAVNQSDRARTVTLEAGVNFYSRNELSFGGVAALKLEPGERRSLELLVPCFRRAGQGLVVSLRAGREQSAVGLSVANGPGNTADRIVAVVAPTPLVAGTVQRAAVLLQGLDAGLLGAPTGSGTTAPRTSAPGAAGWHLFEVGSGELPSRPAAWSGLDAVVVDGSGGPATVASLPLASLVAWVRTGGLLVVTGGPEVLAAIPGLADALDDRLAILPLDPDETAPSTWRLGLGRVAWVDANADIVPPTARLGFVEAVTATHEESATEGSLLVAHGPRAASSGDFLVVPGVGELPVEVFVLLLLAFAIIVGPVNLVVLRRLNRPALLLLTIPVISLVASLLILGFGLLHQGLGLKGSVHSFTLLDQRSGRADTVARVALHAGTGTGDLRPERGTIVQPDPWHDQAERRLEVQHGDGLRLTGGWVPVRQQSNLLISSDAPARSRLEVRRDGDELVVQNALDARLLELEVCDAAGQVYGPLDPSPIEPGAEVRMRRIGGWSLNKPGAQPTDPAIFGRARELRSSWIATLDRSPFVDAAGLSPKYRSQRHVVQGLLPEEESEWNR